MRAIGPAAACRYIERIRSISKPDPMRPTNRTCTAAFAHLAAFAAAVLLGVTAVGAVDEAEAQSEPQTEAATLADCEQDNSARLALRACSALLRGADLLPDVSKRIYAARGRAWLREEEPDSAVEDFTKALEIEAANIAVLEARARAYTQLDDHLAAAGDWSAIIAAEPAEEAPYLKRAESLLAAGDTAAALADYDRLLGINAKNVAARIGRGNAFVARGEKDKAYREFDLAEADAPQSWQVFNARGRAADNWGDTTLAIENYTKTLRLNTVNWDARRALRRMGVMNIP